MKCPVLDFVKIQQDWMIENVQFGEVQFYTH